MKAISITPLGTVSPYPKGISNCPAFLLKYGTRLYMLDCGSGSTRLLDMNEDLKNLSVFLTHYHEDHISDIGALQYASFTHHNLGLLNDKIKIYLPANDFRGHKDTILANKESYSNYTFIHDGLEIQDDKLKIHFYNNRSHAIESFLVKIQDDNHKIIYTSDIGTDNFNELVSYCRNADLIICESSYLLEHGSLSGGHFTADKAGELAALSNARNLMLTHFWPHIDKEKYLNEALKRFPNTTVAEEGKKFLLQTKN